MGTGRVGVEPKTSIGSEADVATNLSAGRLRTEFDWTEVIETCSAAEGKAGGIGWERGTRRGLRRGEDGGALRGERPAPTGYDEGDAKMGTGADSLAEEGEEGRIGAAGAAWALGASAEISARDRNGKAALAIREVCENQGCQR